MSDLELAESKIFNNNNIFDNKEEIINSPVSEDSKLSIAKNQFDDNIANTFNNDLSQNSLFNEPNQLANNITQDSQNSSPILRQNTATSNFAPKENSQENIQKTNPQLANFISDLEHHADNDQDHLSQFINHQDNSQNNNFSNIGNQHIIDHDSDINHQADSQIDRNQHNLQNTNLNYQPQVSKPLVNEDVIIQSATSVQQLLNAKTLMSGINNFMQSPYPLEIAIQLMEPKLEQWLNENLSQIVEKVVRDEIKRIMPK